MAPYLEAHALARVFRGREGKGGRQTARIELMRRGTWQAVEVPRTETTGGVRQESGELMQVQKGRGGSQPLSAPDMDMG
jgi:catalase (peroxidase I)